MRKLFVTIFLLAPLVAGCDSLRARMVAQDAVKLYHNGDLRAAATKFAEAEKLDPNIPSVELDLGFANLALYQADPKGSAGQRAAGRAIAAFERYLQLQPNEERAQSYLIQTFVDTGHYDDAVAFFKNAVEKTPPDPEALGTLGTIANKTGRFVEAKIWYEKRIEAQPNNADARLAVGILIWDFLHNHLEVTGADRLALSDIALKTMDDAIKLNPNSPNGYTYTNLVYREKALGETSDDGKRVDLEQANKFFKLALERQKIPTAPKSGEKKGGK